MSVNEDYDPEGAEWIDVSTIGSLHVVEMDTTKPDHYRHALIISDHMRFQFKQGLPP